MTTKTKSKKAFAKASELASKGSEISARDFGSIPPVTMPSINNTLLGLTDSAIRAISVLSASLMFAQPHFAKDANPQNILGLADVFFKYAAGRIEVNQPEEVAKETTPAS